MSERRILILEPMAEVPEVGFWLSAMVDARRDTLRELDGLPDAVLDARTPSSENTIGTVLYHVALIEADWLIDDIFETPLQESELRNWFPEEDREDDGRLTPIEGERLESHLRRLAAVRDCLIERVQPMSAVDFHRPRSRPAYDASPAWVIHHLLQHEAEHRAEIGWLKRQVSIQQ